MAVESSYNYQPVNWRDSSEESDGSSDVIRIRPKKLQHLRRICISLTVLCLSLLMVSIWTGYKAYYQSSRSYISPHTEIDLRPVTRFNGYYAEPYRAENFTRSSAAWALMNKGTGMVAVSNNYATEHGLPPSIPYPKDDSKSVYFMAAYHSLHCLPYMRRIVHRFATGYPVLDNEVDHAYHCVNVLREELMCTASDNLMSLTMTVAKDEPIVGYDQPRQCTNFALLRDFAIEHSACWLPPDEHMDHPEIPVFGENCKDTDGLLLGTGLPRDYDA